VKGYRSTAEAPSINSMAMDASKDISAVTRMFFDFQPFYDLQALNKLIATWAPILRKKNNPA
jgi:hypothetical protein